MSTTSSGSRRCRDRRVRSTARGSLAGTIRFISNKPSLGGLELGYDVETNKYGDGDFGAQLESYVNVTLTDTLAVRLMGFYRRDGGYIDNVPNNGTFNDGRSSVLSLGDENPDTFYVLDNSGIAKNDYNPIEQYGGRLAILWELTPGWDIMPSINAQREIADGYFGFDPRVGDLQVRDYDVTENDDRWYQAQLSINGHIGDFDLVSATGYYQRKVKLLNDYTYYTVTYDGFGTGYENYLQFFDADSCTGSGPTLQCDTLINPQQYYRGLTYDDQFTQEIRLSTPTIWPFDVTLGGFYQWRKQQTNSDYAIHGLDTIAGYTQSGGGDDNPGGFGIPVEYGGTLVQASPAVKRDAFYLSERDNKYEDKGIFAEGHYDITPDLTLTAGIRYFWTKFSTVGFSGVMASAMNTTTSLYVPTGMFGCPVPLPAGDRLTCLNTNSTAADQVGRYKEDGETHKVALNWQVTPDKMIYANYSTGFRPGGFNRPLRIRGVGIAAARPMNRKRSATTSWA